MDASAVFAVTLAAFQQQQQQRTVAAWDAVMADYDDEDEELGEEGDESRRVFKRRRVYLRGEYKKSEWWVQLEELKATASDHTSRAARRFRQNFRVPYPFFLALVDLVMARDWFPTGKKDASGRPAIPVELKVRSQNFGQERFRFRGCHILSRSSAFVFDDKVDYGRGQATRQPNPQKHTPEECNTG